MDATEPILKFTAADYELVQTNKRRLSRIRDFIAKAQACGINCDNECAACDGMTAFLDAFETEFLTPPPPGSRKVQ